MNGDDLCTLQEFLDAIDRLNHDYTDEIRGGYRDGYLGRIGEGEKTEVYWRSHRNGSEARARGAHQLSLGETA